MIQAGQPFPKFSLPNQDGKTVSLSDFAGKWLVVYVYPKDDTPGCTIQGKSFTATKADFDAAGISVVLSGLGCLAWVASIETLGYCRLSLRDGNVRPSEGITEWH